MRGTLPDQEHRLCVRVSPNVRGRLPPCTPKLASLGVCCGKALAASSLYVAGLVRFPHGVVDDVEGIAGLTSARGLGLHVDNCLGGFLLTHLQAIGAFTRPFDFQARLRC
jgi:hypothetical protein